MKTLWICVVLLVVSVPIAMQVVFMSTMALGSRALAEKQAIVSRLASIEELTGMEMLCSDKTGTLTQNIMTIESKLPWCETSEQQLLMKTGTLTQHIMTIESNLPYFLYFALVMFVSET